MAPAIYVFLLLARLVASDTVCPDGSVCNTGDTCCKLTSGKYTCCPLPNAVCCKDQEHCCPSGYLCDNETDACKPPGIIGMAQTAFRSHSLGNSDREPSKLKYVFCGAQSEAFCPSNHTCCTTGVEVSTNHSCCPSRGAVCCADGKHCCPRGTACDLAAERCIYNEVFDVSETRTLTLTPAKRLKNQTTSTAAIRAGYNGDPCPAGYYLCPDEEYCCPSEQICYSDICFPMSRSVQQTVVPCRDGKSHCPDAYTCCQAPDGSYSCCPLEDAVCCDDHIHCCPKGTWCNPDRGACQKEGLEGVPWSTKVPASIS